MIATINAKTAYFAVPAEQLAFDAPGRHYGRRLPRQRPRFSDAPPTT